MNPITPATSRSAIDARGNESRHAGDARAERGDLVSMRSGRGYSQVDGRAVDSSGNDIRTSGDGTHDVPPDHVFLG